PIDRANLRDVRLLLDVQVRRVPTRPWTRVPRQPTGRLRHRGRPPRLTAVTRKATKSLRCHTPRSNPRTRRPPVGASSPTSRAIDGTSVTVRTVLSLPCPLA